MSILTDILVASPADADAIFADLRHFEKWPCIQLKGLDPSKLAALARAMSLTESAEMLDGDPNPLVSEKEGPWVFLIPSEMRVGLASLQLNDIPAIAGAWVEDEELRFDGWTSDDVAPVLRELQPLAARAGSEGKELLLWMSL